MQVVQPMLMADDFIPLYIIEAARSAKGFLGNYKTTQNWSFGAIVYKDVVFNMEVIGQNPRKLLMTMLLYCRSSANYSLISSSTIVTNAFRYFFDHYRDSCRFEMINGRESFSNEAVAIVILILKFYPKSKELSRLIDMILPAFLGATNFDAGHIFDRRPFVFAEIQFLRFDEVIANVWITARMTNFLTEIMTEYRRRVACREVAKLEKQALTTFLKRFLQYTTDDCYTVMVSLQKMSRSSGNRCSLEQFYKLMLPWDTDVPDLRYRVPPVPISLLSSTLNVLFRKPIEVDGVCSSCWLMQQSGAPRKL